jgi:hypothetical protein
MRKNSVIRKLCDQPRKTNRMPASHVDQVITGEDVRANPEA